MAQNPSQPLKIIQMKKSTRRGRSQMTMHEAAKLIGVSPMTVSRVLNADPKVKNETRARVEKAIRQIGYAPDPAARRLAGAKTMRIGLIYNNPSVAYLNEFLLGILDVSDQIGSQIVLEKCGTRDVRPSIEKILADGLDGVMLLPPLSCSQPVIEFLRASNIPFVSLAGAPADNSGLSIEIDNFEAARAMTDYLISLGHRDIAFIRGAANQLASTQRQAGYIAALENADIAVRTDRIKPGNFTYKSGLLAAQELLATADRPSAIFASNDDMAAATIATAHRLHLDVPSDLAVAGFDDTLLATTIWPPLTTVKQPIAVMAKKAAALLIKEIGLRASGKTSEPIRQIMKFSLIKRESSAAK